MSLLACEMKFSVISYPDSACIQEFLRPVSGFFCARVLIKMILHFCFWYVAYDVYNRQLYSFLKSYQNNTLRQVIKTRHWSMLSKQHVRHKIKSYCAFLCYITVMVTVTVTVAVTDAQEHSHWYSLFTGHRTCFLDKILISSLTVTVAVTDPYQKVSKVDSLVFYSLKNHQNNIKLPKILQKQRVEAYNNNKFHCTTSRSRSRSRIQSL